MRHSNKTEFGTVKIHKEAISAIAEAAALEVQGVARLGEPAFKILEQLPFKKRGVKVEIEDSNDVRITIFVIAKYGYHLSEVAQSVQDSVRKAIDQFTDLNLREINIDIKGIDNPQK
jgi:uncharacterized alkaline shock family protein YloU